MTIGFQLTGSGVKDCEGCGEHVMVSDLTASAFCGDGECVNEGDCSDCFTPIEDHCGDCGACVCECGDDEDEECDTCGCTANESAIPCDCDNGQCPAGCGT